MQKHERCGSISLVFRHVRCILSIGSRLFSLLFLLLVIPFEKAIPGIDVTYIVVLVLYFGGYAFGKMFQMIQVVGPPPAPTFILNVGQAFEVLFFFAKFWPAVVSVMVNALLITLPMLQFWHQYPLPFYALGVSLFCTQGVVPVSVRVFFNKISKELEARYNAECKWTQDVVAGVFMVLTSVGVAAYFTGVGCIGCVGQCISAGGLTVYSAAFVYGIEGISRNIAFPLDMRHYLSFFALCTGATLSFHALPFFFEGGSHGAVALMFVSQLLFPLRLFLIELRRLRAQNTKIAPDSVAAVSRPCPSRPCPSRHHPRSPGHIVPVAIWPRTRELVIDDRSADYQPPPAPAEPPFAPAAVERCGRTLVRVARSGRGGARKVPWRLYNPSGWKERPHGEDEIFAALTFAMSTLLSTVACSVTVPFWHRGYNAHAFPYATLHGSSITAALCAMFASGALSQLLAVAAICLVVSKRNPQVDLLAVSLAWERFQADWCIPWAIFGYTSVALVYPFFLDRCRVWSYLSPHLYPH